MGQRPSTTELVSVDREVEELRVGKEVDTKG